MNKSKRIAISLVAGVLAALLCMVYGSSIRSQAGRIKTSGALTDVLANIDLPIKIGEDTGVLLKGKIVSKDKEWSLMTVDSGNIALHIGDNGQLREYVRLIAVPYFR